MTWGRFGALACLASLLFGSSALAQDRAVLERLQRYGRMPPPEASRLVRQVGSTLSENAGRGGLEYDRLRQSVGRSMFDGPGDTREEYEARLEQVLARLRDGLTEQNLEALFAPRANAAVLCANDFPVTIADCDALVAAASREEAMLPFTPPDDGAALSSALRRGGARREATPVARKLRAAMLGVPRTLSRDERGRLLLGLLESCPGGLTNREAQVRAWHVGPTEGMARCLVRAAATGRRGGATAVERLGAAFELTSSEADAVLRWAAPGVRAAPSPPPGLSTSSLLDQGRAAFRAQRFSEAAGLYQQATTIDPTNPRGFAGLGSALLSASDPSGAVRAYESAILLAPGNAGYHAMLGRARAELGQTTEARSAFQRALAIQPGQSLATQGLRDLGRAPPRPAPPGRAVQPAQQDPAEAWRGLARGHFRARRFAEAAAAYEQATQLRPADAGLMAGLGASRLALGDAAGAVRAYRAAVQLDTDRSSFWSALARAQNQSGDRRGAVASLERAVALDPNNRAAQAGLRALRDEAPPAPPVATAPTPPPAIAASPSPQLPDTPPREEILRIMRPLQTQVAACAPEYHGRVQFRFSVTGETGEVTAVALEADGFEDPEAEACMCDAVRQAVFPTFVRESIEIAYPYLL